MRPSQIFGWVGRIAELGSYAHTIASIASVLRGHEPTKDSPPVVQGLYGVLGYGDERTMQVLMNQLTKKDREILTGFVAWHFKTGNLTERTVRHWYQNAFRSFVTKMGDPTEGRTEGTEETVINSESYEKTTRTKTKTRTVLKKELRSKGCDNRLDFLKLMLRIIKSEPVREDGYKKLLAYFEAFGVPHVPPKAHQFVSFVEKKAGELTDAGRQKYNDAKRELESVATHLENQAALRKADKPWLQRILQKI